MAEEAKAINDDHLYILPMEPYGIEPIPVRPVEIPKLEPIQIQAEAPPIKDSVSFINIILLWIKEGFITNTLQQKGGIMNNDNKATATSIATGVVALVGLFGLGWSLEVVTGIVTVGLMVLGYFTNKKETPAPTETAK
jgi:hypothetical protein